MSLPSTGQPGVTQSSIPVPSVCDDGVVMRGRAVCAGRVVGRRRSTSQRWFVAMDALRVEVLRTYRQLLRACARLPAPQRQTALTDARIAFAKNRVLTDEQSIADCLALAQTKLQELGGSQMPEVSDAVQLHVDGWVGACGCRCQCGCGVCVGGWVCSCGWVSGD